MLRGTRENTSLLARLANCAGVMALCFLLLATTVVISPQNLHSPLLQPASAQETEEGVEQSAADDTGSGDDEEQSAADDTGSGDDEEQSAADDTGSGDDEEQSAADDTGSGDDE